MQQSRAQAERLLLRLAVGARDRAAVAVVSAHRDGGVASARAVVLRARRHARDHRAHPATTRSCRRAPRPRAAPGSRGRRRRIRAARSTISSTISRCCASCSRAEPAKVRGHAHYLLRLNENLKRSVTARWGARRSQWTPFDGITRVTSITQAMLESQRLGARAVLAVGAAEVLACPYQFLLSAIYRLEPAEEPEPLQKLDPLTRGALFHEVQAEFFRALQAARPAAGDGGGDPATRSPTLDAIVARVAGDYHETARARDRARLARRDRRHRARTCASGSAACPAAGDWMPDYFEFSFGLPKELDEGRDPAQRARIRCSSTAASSCAARST